MGRRTDGDWSFGGPKPDILSTMSSAAEKVPKKPATLADLLALADDGRGYEIVSGELVEKQTSGEHSRAQAAAMGVLFPPFSRRPGGSGPGGWWFGTESL